MYNSEGRASTIDALKAPLRRAACDAKTIGIFDRRVVDKGFLHHPDEKVHALASASDDLDLVPNNFTPHQFVDDLHSQRAGTLFSRPQMQFRAFWCFIRLINARKILDLAR